MPRTARVGAAQARSAAIGSRLGQLELLTARLVRGLLTGGYATSTAGAGWDRAEARAYEPGDDVRHLDWTATARCGSLVVRSTLDEREVRLAVVVDGSASMAFGTHHLTKHETASCLAAALVGAAGAGGNTALLVHAGEHGSRWLPTVSNVRAAAPALRVLAAAHPAPASATDEPASELPTVLRRLGRSFGRTDLVVVLTDLISPGWAAPLRALAATRPVVVVQIVDRRERELTAVGDLALEGPGVLTEVASDDPTVRARYARAATELANRRHAEVVRAGATHVTVDTGEDVAADALAVLRSLTRHGPHATSSHTVRSPDVAVR